MPTALAGGVPVPLVRGAVASERLQPGDEGLARMLERPSLLPEGVPVPHDDQVVILAHAAGEDGILGWISESGKWCSASLDPTRSSVACQDVRFDSAGPAKVYGPFHGLRRQGPPLVAVTLALVLGARTPFAFDKVSDESKFGPLRQATAVLDSGAVATFLAWESSGPLPEGEVCDSARTVCFGASDFVPG